MVVRTDLRRHLTAFDGATVLVTHDPLDALVLADQLIVIEAGRSCRPGAGRGRAAAAYRLRRASGRAQPAAGPGVGQRCAPR